MNITFFIGNGFDLNLGLKTRYQDFYKYFHEHGTSNNMIKEWINEKEKLKRKYFWILLFFTSS